MLENLKVMVVNEPQLYHLETHNRKISKQQEVAIESERLYDQSVNTVNDLIEQIKTTYRENLNLLQIKDSDSVKSMQVNF